MSAYGEWYRDNVLVPGIRQLQEDLDRQIFGHHPSARLSVEPIAAVPTEGRLRAQHAAVDRPSPKPRGGTHGGRASWDNAQVDYSHIRISDSLAHAVYRAKQELGLERDWFTLGHREEDDRGGLW